MKNNETIADIIAAMRDEGRTGESSCLEWVGAKMRHYADRLEAAHRRERGDCAKLREALEMVCDAHYTKEVGGELYEGFEVEVDDGTGRPLICVVKNALAAPPRNCDIVPIEAREAADMFHRERPLHGYCYETHDWLLAPATEQEGGAK